MNLTKSIIGSLQMAQQQPAMHHVEALRRERHVIRIDFHKLRRPRSFTRPPLTPRKLELLSIDVCPHHRPSSPYLLRNPVGDDSSAACEIKNSHPGTEARVQHHLSCRGAIDLV